MKLKTKILVITSAVMFFALIISNFTILAIIKKALLKEKIANEKYMAVSIFSDFSKKCITGEYVDKEVIQYYFKGLRNDYIVCYKFSVQTEEYFNRTIYSVNDIMVAYAESDNNTSKNVSDYFILDKKAKIYAFECGSTEDLKIYYISDFNDVYNRINILTIAAILISVLVLGLCVAVLYYVLKLSLNPLSELSRKAKLIADGDYSKRINIKNKDEVGTLSDDFNKMAQAVEIHTKQIENESEKRLLFMGNLTHELKTPLTAIQGYSETMLTAKLSDEDKSTALMFINSECKRLNRLSKKMMSILELNNEETVNLQNVPLNNLFSSVYDSCVFTAIQKNVTLKVIPTELVISTDSDLMTDVLVNLCDNAIKASKEDSTVLIYTENQKIIVEDSGCGIPEDEIQKITEAFYRVDKSRSRKNGGCGLGLYLTSLIVEKLGMKLLIQSEIGKGTKMIIYNSFKS